MKPVIGMLGAGLLVLKMGLAEAEPLQPTYEAIKSYITAFEAANPGRTLSIPKILSQLPEDYRAGFTLMHSSKSLQDSSYENPRVIMFGDDARTVMAFNGDSSQRGYSKVEFAYVDELTDDLIFRSMTFPRDDSEEGRVVFSDPNPPQCMGCHGSRPHYVWGQYATWPGAYGENWDAVERADKDKLLQFKEKGRNHPRYGSLVYEFEDRSPYAPYMDVLTDGEGVPAGFRSEIETRPNARLGLLLFRHQANARIAEISRHPNFEKHQYGFAYFASECATMFGKELAVEVKEATGQSDWKSYATFFDNDIRDGWHFSLTSEGMPPFIYYPGLWFFQSGINGALWQKYIIQDPELTPFYVALKFGDYVRNYDNGELAETERGKEFWDIMDSQGMSPTTFPGLAEAGHYSQKLPRLSEEDAQRACRLLAEKTIEALSQ